ncbi:hypothetical protein [Chryseolinea sp. H1M3-3]|uniref:hypothetical protein n=1 Tax=Chryseolinea sp. H1M3-3 TaxID=3034144 RepID=UPI0023ED0C34|nr:hypothetical protein [Chryseolinea sp. H1M3-3]
MSTVSDSTYSLQDKVDFLSNPKIYPATTVEVLETHMSYIFFADQFVYKLKKPVLYDFLDFRSKASRYFFCMEELRINQPLASDTYLDVVPLTFSDHGFSLDGKGDMIDWLVKMKRLPKEYMLDKAIERGLASNDRVEDAAEMLVGFYMTSAANRISAHHFRQQFIREIELNSVELLRKEFNLEKSAVVRIPTDLLHFVFNYANYFDERVSRSRIVDGHGDLRPEHICLAPKPVIIDRIEFNTNLRVLDVAEELSFLALECEILNSPAVGQIFLKVYETKSYDKIPKELINFYKAKRAFLRAKLSIHHLLEKRYQTEKQKWINRCNNYLAAARVYCDRLPKKS